jgi:hypothetical protein
MACGVRAKGPLLVAPSGPRRYVPDAVGQGHQMYIFAKFVSDHIFLQNRDKLNI